MILLESTIIYKANKAHITHNNMNKFSIEKNGNTMMIDECRVNCITMHKIHTNRKTVQPCNK